MTVLVNAPRMPGDQPFAALVGIELVGDNGTPVVGYVSGTDRVVQTRLQFKADGNNPLSDALGEWEVDLDPNSLIEPGGTVYRITEQRGRSQAATHIVTVPAIGGPFTVLECLDELPGTIMAGPLAAHIGDGLDAHDASAISVIAAGNLAAVDAQSAFVELDAQDTAEAAARVAADSAEAAARIAADATVTADLAAAVASTTASLATKASLTTRDRFLRNKEFGGSSGGAGTIDQNALSIFHINNPFGPGVPVAYFNDGGHFYTVMSINVSGRVDLPDAYNKIRPLTTNGYMIGAWTDLTATEPALCLRTNFFEGPWIQGRAHLGYRRWELRSNGDIGWAPDGAGGVSNLEANPANDVAVDLLLGRKGAGVLGMDSTAASNAEMRINSPGGEAIVQLQRNGANGWSVHQGSAVTSSYILQGTAIPLRMYSSSNLGRVAIGGGDRTGSVLSVIGNNTTIPHLTVKKFSNTTTADLFQAMDELEAVLFRIGRGGRPILKVPTPPPLGDLADGETALSNDAAGNLIVTSRVAGALKTATVAVA